MLDDFSANVLTAHRYTFRVALNRKAHHIRGRTKSFFPCEMHVGVWMNPSERGAGLRKIDSVLWTTTHKANMLYSCFWDKNQYRGVFLQSRTLIEGVECRHGIRADRKMKHSEVSTTSHFLRKHCLTLVKTPRKKSPFALKQRIKK